MSKWGESVIFTQLGLKDGQTFTGLYSNTGINRDSFRKGLKKLKEKKLIRKEGKLYYINSKIKNPMLLSLKDTYTTAKRLEDAMQVIRESKNPFNYGFILICHAMRCLVKLTFERHAVIRLTPREKDEFENLTMLYNTVIEITFKILRKNNSKRMLKLKKALNIAMFDPNLLSAMKKSKSLDSLI